MASSSMPGAKWSRRSAQFQATHRMARESCLTNREMCLPVPPKTWSALQPEIGQEDAGMRVADAERGQPVEFADNRGCKLFQAGVAVKLQIAHQLIGADPGVG